MKPLTGALVAVQQNAERLKGEPGKDGRDGKAAISKPGLAWRGTWLPAQTYIPGDVVEVDGSAYVATTVTTEKPPGSGWDLLAARGATGFSQGRGFPRGLNSGMVIDDEGSRLNSGTVVGEIDFAGAGVTAAMVGPKAVVTIPGGGGGSQTLAQVLAVGAEANVPITFSGGGVIDGGGNLYLEADFNENGESGSLNLQTAANGASAQLQGGYVGGTGPGGQITAGGAAAGVKGGDIAVVGGSAVGGSNAGGGDVNLTPGTGDGAGLAGRVVFALYSEAAGIPTVALTTLLYGDTTAVTGGLYVWTGSAYRQLTGPLP